MGESLTVQSFRVQQWYVCGGPGFDSLPRLQQIVVTFTTDLLYFGQNTTIHSILRSVVEITAKLRLGKKTRSIHCVFYYIFEVY